MQPAYPALLQLLQPVGELVGALARQPVGLAQVAFQQLLHH